MNDKERILRPGSGSGPGTPGSPGESELSEKETEALLALLRSAYPSPPAGLKAAVLERIRAESGAEDGTDKILPVADSRGKGRGIRRAFVRWGALAACILLVGAVGMKLLPSFTNKQLSADSAADAQTEASTAEQAFFSEEFDEAVPEAAPEPEPEEAARAEGYAAPYDANGAEIPEAGEKKASAPMEIPMEEPAPAMPESYAVFEDNAEAEYEYDGDYPAAYGDSAAQLPAEAPVEAEAEAEESYAYPAGLSVSEYGATEEAADGYTENDGLSMKLFQVNPGPANGDGWLRPEEPKEGEIPRMGTGAMNSGADFAADNDSLTYYYVRTMCVHADTFRNSYHDIPDVLIGAVGPSLFASWASKVQSEDLCGVNILSFAVRFGFSAEDIYAKGDVWYFLDLPDDIPLTEENAEAVEQYYIDGGNPGKMIPRLTVYELKTAMIREAGLDAYLAWRKDADSLSLRSWTIAEGAAGLGISDARLTELYEEAAEKVRAEYGSEYIPSPEDVISQ